MADIYDRLNAAKKKTGDWTPKGSAASRIEAARNTVEERDGVKIPPLAPASPKPVAMPTEAPGMGERLISALKGTGANRVAGHLGTAENLLGLGRELDIRADTKTRSDAEMYERNAKHYKWMLDHNQTPDGQYLSPQQRDQFYKLMKKAEQNAGISRDVLKTENRQLTDPINKVDAAGDRMQEIAEQNHARGKQGLGTIGSLAYDVGTGAVDVLADMGENMLLPGLGTAGRFSRTYGNTAEAAQDAGATVGQQALVGGLTAGAGEVINRAFGGNPILEKATGRAGALDDILFPHLGKTLPGRMVKSGIGEAIEEGVENPIDYAIRRGVYDHDGKEKFSWQDMGRDALVGGLIGGLTGISAKKGTDTPTRATEAVQESVKPTAPVDAPTANVAPAASQGPRVDVAENATTTRPAPDVPDIPAGDIEAVGTDNAVGTKSEPQSGAMYDIMTGGKRVDYTALSNEDFNSVEERGDIAMDADHKVYKVDPAQHIDVRTDGQISDRRVNAFQFDHPELKDYYTPMAQTLLTELDGVVPGGQTVSTVGENGPYSWRTKRSASPRIEALLNSGMNKDRIAAALDAIIQDHGAENKADAKRVEMVIDDMLTNGYSDGTRFVPANEQYVADKNNIVGNRGAERGHGLDDVDADIAPAANNRPAGIKVYRGFNRSQNPNERNLASMRTIDDVLGREPTDSAEMLPYAYYTENADDARGYAEHDQTFMEQMRDLAKRKYAQQVMDGRIQNGTPEERSAWIEREAVNQYKTLTGREAPSVGNVGEYTIAPNRVLDLYSLGNETTPDAIYELLERETGIPASEIDDRLVLSDLSEDGGSFNTFKVLRNMPGGNIGTRFYDFVKGLGYDAIRYNEHDNSHYALLPGATVTEESSDVGDGLGAADSGSLNSDYDRLQAQSDEFHDEGANAARPVDVPTKDFDGRNTSKSSSTVMGAQAIPDEAVPEIEQLVADGELSYDIKSDSDALNNAEDIIREKTFPVAVEYFQNRVKAGATGKDLVALGQRLMVNAANARDGKAMADILVSYARLSTNTAQSLQAMSILRKLSPESQLYSIQSVVDQMNAELGEQGVEIDPDLLTKFMEQTDQDGRNAVMEEIEMDIAQKLPGTFKEKANSWRYTAMLLNPTTHIRNILGNAIQAGARTIKNTLGMILEKGLVKDKSKRTKSVLSRSMDDVALKDLGRELYEQDKTTALGEGKYKDDRAAMNRGIQEKRQQRTFSDGLIGGKAANVPGLGAVDQAVGKGVQKVSNFGSNALEKEDVAFNKPAYVSSFAQALKARGISAAEARANPHDPRVMSARDYAIKEAQKATYRNSTALSDALSSAGNYHGKNPAIKAASFAFDALMPFRKTPANILTTGIEYSPAGFAKTTYDALTKLQKGEMDAAQVVDELSANLTGTGIMVLGAVLAKSGILKAHVGDEDDPKEKAYRKQLGEQDYALTLGDKTYTLDWAVPAAMPLFAGAAAVESVRDQEGFLSLLASVLNDNTQVILETSMLSAIDDMLSGISYAENKPQYIASRIATGYASQYVPTLGGRVASVMDDKVRKSYTEQGVGQAEKDLSFFGQGVQKKIPGKRQELQPAIDLWGREISNGTVGERVFQNFFSPGYMRNSKKDAVDNELLRLHRGKPEKSVLPGSAPKSIAGRVTVDKNGNEKKAPDIIFTAQQYTDYARDVGKTRHDLLEKSMKAGWYKKMNDREKASFVSDVYDYSTQLANERAGGKYASSWVHNARNAKKDLGISTGEFIILKKKYGGAVTNKGAYENLKKAHEIGLTPEEYFQAKAEADTNGNGRVDVKEAKAYLRGKANPGALWDLINDTSNNNPYK